MSRHLESKRFCLLSGALLSSSASRVRCSQPGLVRQASAGRRTFSSQSVHRVDSSQPSLVKQVQTGNKDFQRERSQRHPAWNQETDFYSWFLSRRPPGYKPPEPGTWLRFLDPEASTNALPTHLRADPLSTFQGSEGSLEMAQLCLEAFIATHRSDDREGSKQAARAQYMAAKPGSRALHWFLNAQGPSRFDLTTQPAFLHCLIYCLVAERADDYIWYWLTVHHTPDFASNWTLSEQRQWKGKALRFLVEDKMHWADLGTDRLEEGLNTLLKALDRRLQRLESAEDGFIPKNSAGTWLLQQFLGPESRHVSPTVHERFTHLLRVFTTDPFALQWDRARLHLAHPTAPKPRHFLDFLRLCDTPDHGSVFIADLLNPRHHALAVTFFWTMVNTAQQLHRQGNAADAHWVLDFGRSVMPEYFTLRFDNPYSNKSDSRALRIRPTARELHLGALVDKDGARIDTKRLQDVAQTTHEYDARYGLKIRPSEKSRGR